MSVASSATQPVAPAQLPDFCACPECGALQRRVILVGYEVAHCFRCGAKLYRSQAIDGASSAALDKSIALTSAAAILFLLANFFPVLGLDIKGHQASATLIGAALDLRANGMSLMAGLVLFTTVIVPGLELGGLLYVLLPLKAGKTWPAAVGVYKLIHRLEPWGMIEVFMLGVLVALVKLAHMASIIPGWSLWLLGAFVFLMAAATSSLDPDDLWRRLCPEPPKKTLPSDAQTVQCHDCGWLEIEGSSARCTRCNSSLHARKPNSINRCGALLIAAAILYLPANLLPVMYSISLGKTQADTILSGVVYLWRSGSWPLALVVFFASIMVPMLKLASLSLLLLSVTLNAQWRPVERIRLYRFTEAIGRWSMVDIFVVTMLVALVNSRPFATVDAGPGAIAFGAVVVLTMLAAEAFDPRLIWDALTEDDHD